MFERLPINLDVCEDHHSERTVEGDSAGEDQVANVLGPGTLPGLGGT